jgi:phosphoesterase RecJ-like protein
VKNDIAKVLGFINEANAIGLITHVHGDGDAFGSLLSLRNILEKMGKKVILFSDEPLPKYLEYRQAEARYQPSDSYKKTDLLIGLDIAGKKRFTVPEVLEKSLESGTKTIIIDHHAEGDIYDVVDFAWRKTDISSTSEMVYWLAKEVGLDLDKETAEFLLWGIETDTYFLANPNVFETTMEAREDLLAHGASAEDIKENSRAVSPTSNEEFMKLIHGRIKKNKEKNLAFTYATIKDKDRFGFDAPVSSAVASNLDFFLKPRVLIVIEERGPGSLKVSMRSNHSDVDVAKISKEYGGGGHVKAAGFEAKGRMPDDFEGIVVELSEKIS